MLPARMFVRMKAASMSLAVSTVVFCPVDTLSGAEGGILGLSGVTEIVLSVSTLDVSSRKVAIRWRYKAVSRR